MSNDVAVEVEHEAVEGYVLSDQAPELYVSASVVRNSKSVNVDKKISVRGSISIKEMRRTLFALNGVADELLAVQVDREKNRDI